MVIELIVAFSLWTICMPDVVKCGVKIEYATSRPAAFSPITVGISGTPEQIECAEKEVEKHRI